MNKKYWDILKFFDMKKDRKKTIIGHSEDICHLCGKTIMAKIFGHCDDPCKCIHNETSNGKGWQYEER